MRRSEPEEPGLLLTKTSKSIVLIEKQLKLDKQLETKTDKYKR